MPYDDWLGPRAILAPEMDALERTTLERLACDEHLGVPDKGLLQILDEVQVLLKNVVGVKVGEVRETGTSATGFRVG